MSGETDVLDNMQSRVEDNLVYIDRWSLSLDLQILVQTDLMTILNRNVS